MTRESEFHSKKGKTFFSLPPPNGYQELFPTRVKWLGIENDHSYLSNVEVTKALPGVSSVGCLIKQMNNFKVAVAQSIPIWGAGEEGGKERMRVEVSDQLHAMATSSLR
jgi:hypothetical protein